MLIMWKVYALFGENAQNEKGKYKYAFWMQHVQRLFKYIFEVANLLQ